MAAQQKQKDSGMVKSRCLGCKVTITRPAVGSSSAAAAEKAGGSGGDSGRVSDDASYKQKFAAVDLCAHCLKEKGPEIFMEKTIEVRKKQNEFRRLWTECQRCQDTCHQLIQCTNSDCPIFYRRQKAKIDLSKCEEQLKSLSIDW